MAAGAASATAAAAAAAAAAAVQADESRTGQFLSAAAKGQVDRVKLLLQQGYNANTSDYDKRTALMLAAGNGHKVCLLMSTRWGGQEVGSGLREEKGACSSKVKVGGVHRCQGEERGGE
jgi:opacity protein-like surface antigen